MRFVVSAGPTREHLDDVRFLTSPSSGRMGFAVAAAARKAGHEVVLVSGPVDLPDPRGVDVVRVVSALQMRRAMLAAFRRADVLVMTAAVSDYRPARRRAGKWKKGAARISLPLVRNPDILAEAGRRKGRRVCIGFAVEVRNALAGARRKLMEKNLDFLCLCSPEAFGSPFGDYRILFPDGGLERHKHILKDALAVRIVAMAGARSGGR